MPTTFVTVRDRVSGDTYRVPTRAVRPDVHEVIDDAPKTPTRTRSVKHTPAETATAAEAPTTQEEAR